MCFRLTWDGQDPVGLSVADNLLPVVEGDEVPVDAEAVRLNRWLLAGALMVVNGLVHGEPVRHAVQSVGVCGEGLDLT